MREKLIDSVNKAVRYAVDNCKSENPNAILETQDIADFLIAKDVVPVVRCKDCEWYNATGCCEGFGWCEHFAGGMMDNDFCSHAERKDNG